MRIHHLNLGGQPFKNTIKDKGFRTLHPLNLGGEIAPLRFRGMGLQGVHCAVFSKRTQKAKKRTNSTKDFLNNSGVTGSTPSKARVLRQIAPESSPECSAKSLSHSFFVVPFLSPPVCSLLLLPSPSSRSIFHHEPKRLGMAKFKQTCARTIWNILLGQKRVCRTKVPRMFRIFVPNFAPNFAPNFLLRFFEEFSCLILWKWRPEKIHQKSPPFSMQNPQASSKKKSTNIFWRAGKVTI